ncbi:hypothetical protein GTY86_05160 [Streptomyces sp. SID5770]|uniref:hypothetical protein n=1 Tax=Streptomyces sp. SID5770 TaxID=2690308 RepID=UPI00136B2DE6|nr:hypothetical protein [Streptomyces sp. SID5770]MZE50717.1 hypothetical protein [Streptomyces sp. SID5770]
MTTTADEAETTADRFGLTDRPRRSSGLASLARKSGGADKKAGADSSALTLDSIPDPSADVDPDQPLTDEDLRDFALCESAVRSHHASYWLTGKALDAIASRHLYRAQYPTFDALLEDWDVTLADSSRMRRGWPLAARLLPDVPKLTRSHVEALLPIVERYGVEAAATLHGLLRETLPKVTAKAITEVVRELPGPQDGADPVGQLQEQAEKVLTDPDEDTGTEAPATDAALRQAVSRRARQLANDLKRGRIPAGELTRALTQAFADPDDTRVYTALLRWMKDRDQAS